MTASPISSIAPTTLVIAAALASGAVHAVELRGFRGVAWGAGVDSLGASSQLASTDGAVSCYRRERENMMYGDSRVTDIRFCFHDDHLFMVSVQADSTVEMLANEFQSTYGPPDVRAPIKTAWGDRSSATRVEIVASAQGPGASMLMYSGKYEPTPKREAKAAF